MHFCIDRSWKLEGDDGNRIFRVHLCIYANFRACNDSKPNFREQNEISKEDNVIGCGTEDEAEVVLLPTMAVVNGVNVQPLKQLGIWRSFPMLPPLSQKKNHFSLKPLCSSSASVEQVLSIELLCFGFPLPNYLFSPRKETSSL